MSLEELESAVARLPGDELAAFVRWLEEYLADAWDRESEADYQAGRLDAVIRGVDADIEAGRYEPLGTISPNRSTPYELD